MNKELMTPNQAILSIVLFTFGSSVVMGITTSVGQDGWLAISLAAICSIPLLLMYGRILNLFPGKNLYEISDALLGKVIGKIVTVFFTWYSIHLAALVLRNFTEFTQVTTMPETPQIAILILMAITTIYLARSGPAIIGKWSVVALILVGLVVVLTFSAVVHQMKYEDICPIMEHKLSEIVSPAFQTFSFPFAESVLFLCIGGAFPKDNKNCKMFVLAVAIILPIFLLVFFRNLSLLGRGMMDISFFPSYVTARIIALGDFFARIESAISSNFLLAGLVKISVCLLAAANGFANLFNIKDYRVMILPAGMISMALSPILYRNTMDMFGFLKYYPFYAFPFQIILPLIIFITGEFYIHKRKKKVKGQAPPPSP